MRMRGKILALCLGISLSALILQTVLYLRTSSTLIYREAKEENLRLMENMQNEIESYARSIENGLLRLYNQSGFISDLRKGVSVETLREKWNRLAYNIGNENFDTSLSVLALYLYTADHEIISTYRKAMTPKHTGEQLLQRIPAKGYCTLCGKALPQPSGDRLCRLRYR